MSLEYVSSLDDPRLDAFARLTDTQLRSRIEPERAQLIAESGKVIERALAGGLTPVSLLMEEKWLEPLAPVIAAAEAVTPELPVFVAPREELTRLTGFELTRGALGCFRRPALPTVAEAVAGARLVAVLENITNHTNVGAIFRSAAALGVDAVLVSPACYDPFYRRAVRVSMGTVFQIPWTRIGEDVRDWAAEGVPLLHELGFTTAAMALSDDSITLDELAALTGRPSRAGAAAARSATHEGAAGASAATSDGEPAGAPALGASAEPQPQPLALVFGTEGDGLAEATLSRCDHTVRIPMDHGVDSLNVAAASAVAFYALRG
ncbi:RNA methyltransferase [Enterorhabdus sp. P55]|uniref:TrmH family RNA methyltransferase n=1 Tax=Enterorhabdus sp. P55 TaxID=2304571 RepID=UPI00136ACF10|nr:RNA methyltransferase [Enterorhabdus sp. P55]NBI32202.1 RNA methyltransferase [Enterorhabdus sp. P55]